MKSRGCSIAAVVGILLALSIAGDSASDVMRVAVPHDAYPGYSICKLHYYGQAFSLHGDEKTSSLFTILADGMLMPVADLGHLVDRPPVKLVVREEAQNGTTEKEVEVRIVDYWKKLRFQQPDGHYSGSVYENEPIGTTVEGLERMFATGGDGKITYSLVSGDDLGHFAIDNATGEIRTNAVLDAESQEEYELVVRATDGVSSADAKVSVRVDNLNDNAPMADRSVYEFRIPEDAEIYTIVGNVSATDADEGDKPVFHFVPTRHPVFAVIPKTGQILLIAHPELKSYKLMMRAQDSAKPPKFSPPFHVYVEVYSEELELDDDLTNDVDVPKTRQRRSVRPTKSYEYKETDGSKPGKVMFQLDKKHPSEMYKMESPVKWVEVDSAGDVKVKEPWDYEQLGKEKTIDFWIFVTGPNINGK
ncbi:hypothetical protein JTE90_027038 [Oedothorax gibbosus]|uniref:Cadherin domain-containing protein n=1 Tax=Oedothorax gibbosus TaxID=931172 RepID=A0AAV6UVF6_9ARAC|nr:hypothetical protein JTE90_027038 [Oedothorax gibbosus]